MIGKTPSRCRAVAIVVAGVAVVTTTATYAARVPVEDGRLAGFDVPAESWTDVRRTRSLFVPMRDGVRLSTDVYRPQGASGALPTILIRTPYNKAPYADDVLLRRFVRQGYAVVVQDHRGTFESEGQFFPYPRSDGPDGYDTVEWITRQSWSNGRIGTFGCSYLGETQHMLARERHKNHLAAIAQAGSSYGGAGVRNFGFQRYGANELLSGGSWMFRNGSATYYGPPAHIDRSRWFAAPWADRYSVGARVPAAELHVDMFAHLPVVDLMDTIEAPPNEWRNWLAKPPADPYWQRQGTITDQDRFDVPTLHMNGWYDLTPTSTLELFRLFRENALSRRAAEHQYLIMYAGTHCNFEYTADAKVGRLQVGNAALDVFPIYIAWFDHWLKGKQNRVTHKLPKVLSYALGANEWRRGQTWPPAGASDTRWFLASSKDARSLSGDGRLTRSAPERSGADRYAYDPAMPVASLGGSVCCGSPGVEGADDQRPIEARADVLVYTSAELTEALEVAGKVRAILHVSANVPDTDLVARLTDVYPDGTSYNVTEGILRLRYRDGLERETFMEPGKTYRVEIDLESTHNVFLPGHRLRLHVTSSSFPRWDRNLNTGGRNYDEISGVIAAVTVHHGPDAQSHLLLPIIHERSISH